MNDYKKLFLAYVSMMNNELTIEMEKLLKFRNNHN